MPADPNAHFVALQAAVLARLTAADAKDYRNAPAPLPVTANGEPIQVLSEMKGDLEYQLEQLTGSIGIAMIVVTPQAALRSSDPRTATLDLLGQLKIQIQENVTQNQSSVGSRVPALSLVVFVLKRLAFWPPNLYGAARAIHRIVPRDPPFTLLSAGDKENPELIYDVDFNVPINLNLDLA